MDTQLVAQEILNALNASPILERTTPNKLIWIKSQEELIFSQNNRSNDKKHVT